MWKPNTLAIELYIFVTIVEKLLSRNSEIYFRHWKQECARLSRCYIWCASEDFDSKLIIDNMYVEVTLQTKYNIRKNSRIFSTIQICRYLSRTKARGRVSWCKNRIILSMWNGFSRFIMIKWQKFKRLSILLTMPKPLFNRKNMISCRK